MKRRRHTPEQIVRKLHEADRLVAEAKSMAVVLKTLGVSELTYYRWRKAYGQLSPDEARILSSQRRARNADNVEVGPGALRVIHRPSIRFDENSDINENFKDGLFRLISQDIRIGECSSENHEDLIERYWEQAEIRVQERFSRTYEWCRVWGIPISRS